MAKHTKFSKWLADRRITSAMLGQLTGFPMPTIHAWRRACRRPGRGNLRILAEALGITPTQAAALFD